jgi:ring-1,2-phenylacetyl-CoA epoxidase subunit PaaE
MSLIAADAPAAGTSAEPVRAQAAIAFHPLRIADVRRETPEAVSIAFDVPPELAEAYRFHPGQHLTLRTFLKGEECRRTYSICAGMDDGELRVAIKRVEDGRFSDFANSQLRRGDMIDVMTPQGRFGVTPDRGAGRIYVAVAAGSGITPVMSIAKTVLAREPTSRFVLIYGNRTAQSIIFKDALEDLKDRHLSRFVVHHVLSREPQDVPVLAGRVDGSKVANLVRASVPVERIDHAFVCGPGGLIAEAKDALTALGVPSDRIHVEYFSPDGTPVASRPLRAEAVGATAEAIATARIMLNGLHHEFAMSAGETIVDAGLRAGIEMPYSCRGGMCCTCRAMLVSGDVTMEHNYSLEPWELKAGFVLTCQAHPTTKEVVVDYDQV